MDMEEKGTWNFTFLMRVCVWLVHREIKILRLFMHPHIIRLYEVIDSPEDVYVVTELAQVSSFYEY